MASRINKGSQYIQSLVDFINDTKPYHSKLTEVVEEYRFFDQLNVRIEEKTSTRIKISPAWTYNFFSGGDATFRSLPLKQIYTALSKAYPANDGAQFGAIRPVVDSIQDIANYNHVYSKKAFDGIGAADVLIERDGNRNRLEGLVEGHDHFLSHGSFQFRVKQITDQNSNFVPSWSETRDADIISSASRKVRRLVNDSTRSESGLSQLRQLLVQISALPGLPPESASAITELLDRLDEPQDYAALQAAAVSDGVTEAADYTGYALCQFLIQRQYLLSSGTITILNQVLSVLDSQLLPLEVTFEDQQIRDPIYERILNPLFESVEHTQDSASTTWTINHGFSSPPDFVIANSSSNQHLIPTATDNSIAGETTLTFSQAVSGKAVVTRNTVQPPAPFTGWVGVDGIPNLSPRSTYVDEFISRLSPSLYFRLHSDTAIRESGRAAYRDIQSQWLNITNISTSPLTDPGDTWHVRMINDQLQQWGVFSDNLGFVGSFVGGAGNPIVQFTSSTINFTAAHVADAVDDDVIEVRNVNRLVFGPAAPLETWDIIKVNPLAYSRPVFNSERYGWIENAAAEPGLVDILSITQPTTVFTLTCRSDTEFFDLTSDVDPLLQEVVQVGFPFVNSLIGFTIQAGSEVPFAAGDRFYIHVINPSAEPEGLDLYYGYDLDLYDDQLVPYTTDPLNPDFGLALNFAYASRFQNYDFDAFDLQLEQIVPHDREFRIVAIPDVARPIDLTFYPQNPAPGLELYYASQFRIEYSDDNFQTFQIGGVADVGSAYVNSGLGISFNLLQGGRPFIGAVSTIESPSVTGGDVFYFKVKNDGPYLGEEPVKLISSAAPRLVMHGDGFHEAPGANWRVDFTSAVEYVVSGVLTQNNNPIPIPGTPLSGRIDLPGNSATEGQTFKNLNVHFTIKPGAGLAAGDSFTFTTYEEKPSYLVHGSVSGWQEPAEVGKPYWNGLIGFKIEKPTAQLFDSTPTLIPTVADNEWAIGAGTIKLSRLRFDAETVQYDFAIQPRTGPKTGWLVTRSDRGVIGFLARDGSTTLSDEYITLEVTGAIDEVDVNVIRLEITADDFDLWNAKDAIIIRSSNPGRMPTADDFILVDKRTRDRLEISLNYDNINGPAPSLNPLTPFNVNPLLIDVFTGPSGIPLSSTSPETAILQNWLPLSIQTADSDTSVAEFPDQGYNHTLSSIATTEPIASLQILSDDVNFPVRLTWNENFFNSYLPLNAEANLVTYGSGFNEIVRAKISESLKFLIGSGVVSTDFQFSDSVTVNLDESHDWTIYINQQNDIDANVNDTFGGFVGGYGNLLYDNEVPPNGYYGLGSPLTSWFHEAQQLGVLLGYLSGNIEPTARQLANSALQNEQRYSQLLLQLGGYLTNGDLAQTTYEEFVDLVDNALEIVQYNPIPNLDGIQFGTPASGLGIDITVGARGADIRPLEPGEPRHGTTPGNDSAALFASASIDFAMVSVGIDPAGDLEEFGLDVGGLDALGDRTAFIYSENAPIFTSVPNPVVIPAPGPDPINNPDDVPYNRFQTPLAVVGQPADDADLTARIFEIGFRIPAYADQNNPTPAELALRTALINLPTPKVFVWRPTDPAPAEIAIVEKIATGRYRINLAQTTEAKIYLLPGV